MICLYDGTFKGLLSVFDFIFSENKIPSNITCGKYNADLFSEDETIASDIDKVDRFMSLLEKRFNSTMFRNIYLVYLSEIKGFEMDLYRYLADAFKIGVNIDGHLHLPSVARIRVITSKVLHEAHVLKGFLRFSKLKSGLIYCGFEPDHFVLPLLASHFKRRFSGFNWAIHDRKRKKALIYEEKKCEIIDVINIDMEEKDSNEDEIESLWRTFFETISVKSRQNLKLQDRMLPKRYRKNMLEFIVNSFQIEKNYS